MSARPRNFEILADPAFVLGPERGLRLGSGAREGLDDRDAIRLLAMRVARHPLDLRAHAQRIHLLADLRDQARLFGALVDLFLALGTKGAELRRALLDAARAALDPEDEAYLRARLASGIDRTAILPMTRGSVLSRGAMGSFSIVSRESAERPEYDPLDDPFYVPDDAK